MYKIALCQDVVGWWIRFEEYAKELGLKYKLVEMERSDWLDQISDCSHVLWRPNLDPPYCDEAREKIFFTEHILGKGCIPNWNTYWHYDNKRAQYYLFRFWGVRTPETFATFSREDALQAIEQLRFPVVSKTAGGAGSSAVRLLRSPREARREVKSAFHDSLFSKALTKGGMRFDWSSRTHNRYVLWQEFIPDNARDLRVTVIGKRHVFAFWRNNRRNDFRASGSGSIDYSVNNVEAECLYCVDLCRRKDFDSMAFDIVYKGGKSLILEMSYAFNDRAIYNAPAHHLVDEAGHLTPITGHVWPQRLTIQYVQALVAQSA